MNPKQKIILRWMARIYGSLILAFLLFFVLVHLFGNDESGAGFLSTKEIIAFTCFPIGAILGLGAAWKWPRWGGIGVLLAMAVFYIVMPEMLTNLYTGGVVLAGVLYVVSGFKNIEK